MRTAEEIFLDAIAASETPGASTVAQLSRRLGIVPAAPGEDEMSVNEERFKVSAGPGRTVVTTADGKMGISFERITDANREYYTERLAPPPAPVEKSHDNT